MTMKILCVSDYFLPGFKGGGPIRTLANLRDMLGGAIEVAVFTRDRDLGADAPYDGLPANQWLNDPQGPIFYADPAHFKARGLVAAMADRRFDLLYLNSFFSTRAAVQPCLLRRLVPGHPLRRLPVLLAPRGEFSPGALALKWPKKRAYLGLAHALGLYRDVHWHASTEGEAKDIRRQFPDAAARIHKAVDPVVFGADIPASPAPQAPDVLRIAFISRISPKKNLDGLLRILAGVNARVHLTIHGPVEDQAHWQECQTLIAQLPDTVRVTKGGPLAPDAVSQAFAQHDLFAFPTHGENFGHVIFEALRAGTPVLLSDQTPWHSVPSGALTTLPLADLTGWRQAIERTAAQSTRERLSLRAATVAYARSYVADNDTRAHNITMFKIVATAAR